MHFHCSKYRCLCPLILVPFSPKPATASQPRTSPKNGSTDVAAAESTCPSKRESMHRAHNPCSPFQTRSGVFMPTHQVPKSPNSCTTAGGERWPNGLEQVVLQFKLAPQCYQQCYGSPQLNSYHDPGPAATICSTQDRPQHSSLS